MAPRLLAVSHDASRTGAPAMLVHFLRWVAEHRPGAVEVEVVLLRGGPLEPDFAALGPVTVLAPFERWTRAEVAALGLRKVGLTGWSSRADAARLRARLARARGHDVVWLNSVASAPVLHGLRAEPGQRVLTAVHELDQVLDGLRPADWSALLARTDRFLAGATGIAENLLRRPGVDPTRVVVGHEFIDVRREIDGSLRPEGVDGAGLRHRLGIPEDAFVVGGCGPTAWRKAPDLFLRLGVALRHHQAAAAGRPIHLVWIGGPTEGVKFAPLAHDLRSARLSDVVHFIGPRPDLTEPFAMFDAFALTSREDALPLVCLEAARAGRPVLAFDNTCLGEVFGDGEGAFVPFLDVDAMAAQLAAWAGDPAVARAVGERAQRRILEGFDVSVGAPRWWDELEGLLP
ncbi:MAG: glycosyltransferase family 4 protein [Acidimicrobiales bacterium]|nr:glycosyltransferase family 4 protein [Acidimicrobiales bacterium]